MVALLHPVLYTRLMCREGGQADLRDECGSKALKQRVARISKSMIAFVSQQGRSMQYKCLACSPPLSHNKGQANTSNVCTCPRVCKDRGYNRSRLRLVYNQGAQSTA